MPVLNEAAGIVATLSPLQSLRAAGAELIVIDGGSDDDTVTRAMPHADRVLHATRGRARQMNAGAAQARGDVLLFLHADTRLPEHADQAIIAALRAADWGRFDVRITGRSPLLRIIAGMMNLRSRLTGIATGDQAIFVKRAAFQAVGGYPEQLLMEDIELSKRLKRRGPPACLRGPAITAGRRWEANGVWRTVFLMWSLRFAYWRGVPVDQLARRYHRPAPNGDAQTAP